MMRADILNSVHSLDPFVSWTWLRALPYLALASSLAAADGYFVHNLDSDLPGVADQQQDTLINPWDFIAFNTCTPVGSPCCLPPNVSSVLITSNGSGTVAQYTPIPGVAQPDLYPNLLTGVTGIIGNFGLPQPGTTGLASGLLVCTEDGIIAGLAEYLPTFVTTLVDNSKSGAIYTGCTFAYPVSDVSRPFYYSANFGNGKIDMWDSNLKPVENPAAFVDPAVPAGFAPFNIQAISDKVLLVTYAQQDTAKRKDVPGTGNGYIAAFDLNGNLLQTLVARGRLNSPWGLMIAPATFGNFAGALLVGNSGDGRINAFDRTTGAWKGMLADPQDNPIAIPGLHAIRLGGGGATGDPSTLYFTAGIAGPNGEPLGSHGLFGSVQAAPYFQASGVQNSADFSSTFAPNTWVSIKGGALSATTRSWTIGDFTSQGLPTKLDNVGVTVNGRQTYVSYISPTQINFLLPVDLAIGPAELFATNNGLNSEPVAVMISNAAPAFFFLFPGRWLTASMSCPVSFKTLSPRFTRTTR